MACPAMRAHSSNEISCGPSDRMARVLAKRAQIRESIMSSSAEASAFAQRAFAATQDPALKEEIRLLIEGPCVLRRRSDPPHFRDHAIAQMILNGHSPRPKSWVEI